MMLAEAMDRGCACLAASFMLNGAGRYQAVLRGAPSLCLSDGPAQGYP